jgi:hypothetical protein
MTAKQEKFAVQDAENLEQQPKNEISDTRLQWIWCQTCEYTHDAKALIASAMGCPQN